MEETYKVIVVGDSAVGKTSFIKKSVLNFFSAQYRATIGTDYSVKRVVIQSDASVYLQLWDIAGQDRFRFLSHVFYRNAAAAIICFDLSRRETFQSVREWKKDIDDKILGPDGSRIPCFLVATKSDLRPSKEGLTDKEIDIFVEENDIEMWFEVSAKSGEGVEHCMTTIGRFLAVPDSGSFSSSCSSTPSPQKRSGASTPDTEIRRKMESMTLTSDRAKARANCAC